MSFCRVQFLACLKQVFRALNFFALILVLFDPFFALFGIQKSGHSACFCCPPPGPPQKILPVNKQNILRYSTLPPPVLPDWRNFCQNAKNGKSWKALAKFQRPWQNSQFWRNFGKLWFFCIFIQETEKIIKFSIFLTRKK